MERLAEILKGDAIVEEEILLSSLVEIRFIDGVMHAIEGVWRRNEEVLVEMSKERVVEVNVMKRELLRVGSENLSGIEHNQVLDLNDDGERWEGDVLNNEPYGWGTLYDNEGNKAYEGFRIGNVNVCFGRSYYSDVGMVEYEGERCDGKRWGRGIRYNRYGDVLFDGEWMNNNPVKTRIEITRENQFLHNHVEQLIVCDDCCNGREWKEVDFSLLERLREIKVGDRCFQKSDGVKITGLKELEKVQIGRRCFAQNDVSDHSDRFFVMRNCERVKELRMGCYSFAYYNAVTIESVDSLEVIEMGSLSAESYNFRYASLKLLSESRDM